MNNGTDSHEEVKARCESTWNTDAAIREEFIEFENYLAFEKAAAAGKVRIVGRKTVS